jgi:hypothetical protein
MTASATSSGSHHRPCGTADNIAASAPGWRALIRSAVGARTSPGATAFTRIPWVAYCSAADLVPDTPCLEEDVSDNTGRAVESQTPVKFVATTRSSSVVSTMPATDPTRPALLKAKSKPPYHSSPLSRKSEGCCPPNAGCAARYYHDLAGHEL